MELMVVMAIMVGVLVVAGVSFRALTKADLRSAAFRTASAVRYTFDRATMTGMYMRLAFDLDKGRIWIEASENMLSLRAGREQHTTDRYESDDERQQREMHEGVGNEQFQAMRERVEKKKKLIDESRKPAIPFFGLGTDLTDDGTALSDDMEGGEYDSEDGLMAPGIDSEVLIYEWEQDMKPIKRPKASFTRLKGLVTKTIKLARGVHIYGVTTPRLTDPIEEGMAFVYFFPQGHSEAAIIHFADEDEEKYFSVVLHPLTGQAKVYGCYYEIPDDFGVSDDEKKKGASRDRCAARGAM